MQETQLLKGILEGCVLGIIAKGETYGYEILSELERVGFDEIGEGTLYPVLTRLDKNGSIQCRRAKSPLGPIRKYYTITLTGKKYLEEFKKNYEKVTESADRFLGAGKYQEGGRRKMDYSYMREQLRGKYQEVFEKTELYGIFSEVNTEVQDDLMMNLFDLLMTAQEEDKPVEKIIGPDMEKFCKEYFQNYNWRERMKYFPVNLYRLMRVIFIFELIDLFSLEGNTDLLHAQSDVMPYLGGLGLSLVLTMIADVFIRPMIFRFKIKPFIYYIGFLLVWAGAVALCVNLEDGMILNIPMFPVLLVSGIYTMIYLIVRSVWRYRHYGSIRRPHSDAKEFERSVEKVSMEQIMLETMLKKYKTKNKRLAKKGKKGLTPGEYTEQVRREYEKLRHSWKWGILVFAAFMVPAIISTALSSTFWDTVLFTLILCAIEGGIYWFIFKTERNTNQIRKGILDACASEGISVVEYAMRKGKSSL